MKIKLLNVLLLAGLFSILSILTIAEPCYANPVVVIGSSYSTDMFWVLWIICPLIEALIITLLLKLRFKYPGKPLKPFLIITLLNLITIPITSILGMLLVLLIYDLSKASFHSIYQFAYIAELFPLIVEFFVLRWLFANFNKQGFLSKPVKDGYTFLLTLGVNIITFLLGFIFYNYWPTIW
jgi:hypothetical protein